MENPTVCTDLGPKEWDAFVSGHPEATAYHQYGWKGIIEQGFGHKAHYLAVRDSEGTVLGILPLFHMKSLLFGKFLISVPFVNYGGIVCNAPGAATTLLKEAERLKIGLKAGHVELRHVACRPDPLPTRRHKVTMILPLAADVDAQWRGFNAKLRNQIRKGEKSDLTCITGQEELLDDFYQVFARNMRDLGTPVHGKPFFRNILNTFPETTRVFAVRLNGKTVAAAIALWFKETLEVPWASSIRKYRPLCPNDLLYWEAIKFAIERGFRHFDFGRSTPNEGTFHFKKQWGALPVQLNWQYLLSEGEELPDLTPKNPKFRLAIRAWQGLPLSVSKLIGPRLIRNIP